MTVIHPSKKIKNIPVWKMAATAYALLLMANVVSLGCSLPAACLAHQAGCVNSMDEHSSSDVEYSKEIFEPVDDLTYLRDLRNGSRVVRSLKSTWMGT